MNSALEQPPREGKATQWATIVAALIYLAAGLAIAWQLQVRQSPDGVAYLQVARHYASGNFDLAVNSWWSPMFSWLLVPFVWLNIPLTLAVRLLDIVWGLGLAFGVRSLAARFTDARGRFLAFILGLVLGLLLLPRYLTPGVLLTCLMTWYFVFAIPLLENNSPAHAFKVGLFGGVAYLTKAYSLPFVAAHLLLTMLIKMFAEGRAVIQPALKQFAFGMMGLLLVATPWIATISQHDGRFTISSVGASASAWSGFPDGSWDEKPIRKLQQPREGRITSWENPMEIPFAFPLWSPFDSPAAMKKQIRRLGENLLRLPSRMSADQRGVMALGLLLTLASLFASKTLSTFHGRLRWWGCLSVLLYVAGYLPILVFDRYLCPIWGLLLVLCVTGPGPNWLASRFSKNSTSAEKPASVHPLWAGGHVVFLAVLTGTLVLSLRSHLRIELRKNGWVEQSTAFKAVAEELNHRSPIAANDWNRAIEVAYWSGSQFIGAIEGREPAKVARALFGFGRPVLLIFRDKELMETFVASPLFTPVKLSSKNIWAFELRKLADGQDLPPLHD